MKRRSKAYRIRRTVAIAAVLGILALTATAVTSTSQLLVLRARVLFLERALTGGINEAEIAELEQRLANISKTPQPERLTALLKAVAELERGLDRPVVTSASQLQALLNRNVYLVGVVTRVTTKDKHLYLTVNDVFCPIWGGGNLPIQVGDLVAIAGMAKEYQGTLEVVGEPKNVLVLERR